jgi:hypothetical protein
MYTWKTIPASDYSIREFKAYKDWEFVSGSDVLLMIAENTIIYNDANTITLTDNFEYNKHSLYGQISSSFYSLTDTQIAQGIRRLGSKAKVFSIPNDYIGDGIKPGSVVVTDIAGGIQFTDNTSGSLLNGSSVVGDIFYNNGIVVYTDTATIDTRFTGNWTIDFKSTQTITEHEIFVSVDKTEYNVSKNPTSVITQNQRWYSLPASDNMKPQSVMVYEGDRYIRKKTKLPNGTILDYRYGSKVINGVSGGFEQYAVSASIDTTGSYLTPFVTTIGLYDTSGSLVAIAKLPKPIKMEPTLPINFIVRFDV